MFLEQRKGFCNLTSLLFFWTLFDATLCATSIPSFKPTQLPSVSFKPTVVPSFCPTRLPTVSSQPSYSLRPTMIPPTARPTIPQVLPTVQYEALHDLYIATDGRNWEYGPPISGAQWNFTGYHNPCTEDWQAVVCNCGISGSCTVAQLLIISFDMVGTLSDTIGNLKDLTVLEIEVNPRLSGTLPASIGNLTQLAVLNLATNSLNGSLPHEIGRLSELTICLLNNNSFTGAIPDEMYTLSQLSNLDLAGNKLHGTLSPRVTQLRSLRQLVLTTNFFSGWIPPELGEMVWLQNIYLNENSFRGSIPWQLGNLSTNLATLYLYDNLLSGTLPSSLGNLSVTQVIELYGNSITGSIPESLSWCSQLYVLRLDANLLTGTIPSVLANITGLRNIYLNNNLLSGVIPNSFSALTKLRGITMNNNALTGTVPPIVPAVQASITWDLSYNAFIGNIPQFLCFENLNQLMFNDNLFTSTIPDCLGVNQTKLTNLYLNSNFLDGSLPDTFGNLVLLSSLYVNDNFLSGRLPNTDRLRSLQTLYAQNNMLSGLLHNLVDNETIILSYVDLSNNDLSGDLPISFFTATSPIQSFSVAGNCITGSIPSEICNLQSLIFLDLDGLSTAQSCRRKLFPNMPAFKTFSLKNHIVGVIPECLFAMNTLETLHLSGNQIQWKLPAILPVSDSVQYLSLSHNQISGTIPGSFFDKQWQALDLSYNKIGGVLLPYENVSANYTLTLQVNRLSGVIPSVLAELVDVNLLNGNLFDCNLVRSNLPVHDRAYEIFQCGSNSFNKSIIIWSCFAGAIVVLLISLKLLFPNPSIEGTAVERFLVVHQKYHATVRAPEYLLTQFCSSMATFRRGVLVATFVLCLFVAPLYLILTLYFKTLAYEYAWWVSAAYLAGQTPAVVLFFVYTMIFVSLFCMRLYRSADKHFSIIDQTKQYLGRRLQLLLVSAVNCLIMIFLNAGYVYVILNYETRIIFCAQLAVAMCKLLWNDFAVRALIKYSGELFGYESHDDNVNAEMPTLTFIVLFNTIIAPCVATAAIDPSCFVNVFAQPEPVTSSFPNFACSVISQQNCSSSNGDTILTTSYDPPFIYSYQCSSALLTNYASVYVYMFLMSAFIKPVLLIVMERFYREIPPDSILHIFIKNTMYGLLKPTREAHLFSSVALFKKERFNLRILSKLTVFLTFGVVFPPIAVVLCVAFYSETYMNEIILGKFLHGIKDEPLRLKFAAKLQNDTVGTLQLLHEPMIKLVVPFAAFFYSCFLFDMYGDQVGWKSALWIVVLMSVMPLLIYLAYEVYRNVSNMTDHTAHMQPGGDAKEDGNVEGGVEMKEVATGESVGEEVVEVENILHVTMEK